MIADLPSIEFVDTDAGSIETSIITMYEAIADRILAQGDPVRLFLQSVAAIIIQQRVLIDYTGKMNLLAYSEDHYLDHIGILAGVTRIAATAAKTTLRFSLSVAQPQAVTIAAGIRVATEDDVVFQVISSAEIPAGQLYLDTAAECMQTGKIGNDIAVGQISRIVDPMPWVQSAMNVTASAGGAEEEEDEALRERIHQAPESFSVAGPDGAYIYWAKTASALIIDVAVYSPSDGVVEIRPLLSGGEMPGAEVLQAVAEKCNDKRIRPLTDKVSVVAPEAVSFPVNLTYYIEREQATSSLAIQQAVSQAVSDYVLWQKSKLGRDINPSELIWRVRAAGASRVEIATPIYTALDRYQVAVASGVTATFGGLTDG